VFFASSSTVIVSAVAVGISLTAVTVTVTIPLEVSPFASVIVYSKVSVPLKFSVGVYKIASSLGLFDVLLLFTDNVPPLLDIVVTKVIALLLCPSPPK
jgi:hypothetical protein